MNNLALTLQAQGTVPGARDLQERVLEARRRILGEESPGTLTSMNNLAVTLGAQGTVPGARVLWAKAFPNAVRAWGPDHPNTRHIPQALDD